MKLLILTFSIIFPIQGLKFDLRNLNIWNHDMPDSEFKKHVAVRFVKKDWMPKGPNLPTGSEIVPNYPGTTREVYETFKDKQNVYTFHNEPIESAISLLSPKYGYDPNQDSIFVIHTISGDANNFFVNNMMTAFALKNYLKNYNIFAFNMPGLQDSMEKTIMKGIFGKKNNLKGLGDTIGAFFDSAIQNGLMKTDKIHLLGFCYSSQLAGYIARHIIKNNNGQKIKSILALDPYSIGLFGWTNQIVTKNDAQVVHAYHTNSIAFGSLYRQATADFVFNGGYMQPGCYFSNNIQCSHRRAATVIWYVLLSPDKFYGRKCSNYFLFSLCLCNRKEIVSLPIPPTPEAKGKYYLKTTGHKPYGYGMSGASCFPKEPQESTTGAKNLNDFDFTRNKLF